MHKGILICLIAVLIPAGSAAAQVVDTSHCDSLRLVVKQHRAGYRAALSNLQSCDASFASDVLLEQWNALPNDSASLGQLSAVSRRYLDARLLSVARKTAEDDDMSRAQRLAAFATLLSYYDAKMVVEFRNTNEVGGYGSRYVSLGSVDHPARETGRVPFPADAQQQVLAIFRKIGKDDDDRVIKAIAAYLAHELVANQ